MTYLVAPYSVMNVYANISGVKWIVEQHVSLLFYKFAIFHTCTHDMEPCCIYTGCPERNVPDFGRMFLKLKYTDITQKAYIQS